MPTSFSHFGRWCEIAKIMTSVIMKKKKTYHLLNKKYHIQVFRKAAMLEIVVGDSIAFVVVAYISYILLLLSHFSAAGRTHDGVTWVSKGGWRWLVRWPLLMSTASWVQRKKKQQKTTNQRKKVVETKNTVCGLGKKRVCTSSSGVQPVVTATTPYQKRRVSWWEKDRIPEKKKQ